MKAKMKKVLKSNKGFTMIELMVVIVIMLILAAIAIPSFNRLIDQANSAAATAEVRTVLTLAQLEAEMIIVSDGTVVDDDLDTVWTAILDDAGIASADQGFFDYDIVSEVVTVYYNNNNGIVVQLPEAVTTTEGD